MTIRNVMADALRRIGREDVAVTVDSGGTPSGESEEVFKTMLYCINAAEKELAGYYFPLIRVETFKPSKGVVAFGEFSQTPFKILSVKSGGKKAVYELCNGYIKTDVAEAEVTYRYMPKSKAITEDSEFGDYGDGLVSSLGAAAEYFLMCGEPVMAEVWETRYREAIEKAQKLMRPSVYIPPRRWV